MRKRLSTCAAAVGALVLAPRFTGSAASAQTILFGGGFQYVTNDCQGVWNGWSNPRATMRPAGLPGNDPVNSRLSLFYGNYAMHFSVPEAIEPDTWTPVFGEGWIGARAGYFEGGNRTMEIKVPSVQPVGTVPPINQKTDPNTLEFHGAF